MNQFVGCFLVNNIFFCIFSESCAFDDCLSVSIHKQICQKAQPQIFQKHKKERGRVIKSSIRGQMSEKQVSLENINSMRNGIFSYYRPKADAPKLLTQISYVKFLAWG